MEIHREMGTILGGVHLELTGEVNEEGFSVVRLSIYTISQSQSLLLRTFGPTHGGLAPEHAINTWGMR